MSGNFAIKGGGGGGVGRLMANAILNFHFDFLNPSLTHNVDHILLDFLSFFAESNIADKMYNSTLCLTMNKPNHWNVVKGTLKMT